MKKNISFIFGPNGSGKGTLSRYLSEKFGFYHLNAGNCLRDWASSRGRFDILDTIDKGEFVDDKVMQEALEEKFTQIGHLIDIIVDGFPRKLSQLNILQTLCKKFEYHPQFLIVLNVPLEVIKERLKDRVVAPDGFVYHMTLNPPPKHFKLSELHTRPDDAPEIAEKRYEYYVIHTLETLADPFFKDIQICNIDATQPIPTVYEIGEEFVNSLK